MSTTACAQPRPAPLRVAVLGAAGPAFAQEMQGALASLAEAASRRATQEGDEAEEGTATNAPFDFVACSQPSQAQDGALRWLLAWEPEPGDAADAALSALQAHNALRAQLHALNLPYQVLRGTRQAQIAQALQSLVPWLPWLAPLLPQTGVASRRPGAWSCESCSDPVCEHRSFTELLARREATGG